MYGWAMSQILQVNGFKWVEETFQFNEDFIKIYDEDSDIEYIMLMFNFLKNCMNFIMIYSICLKKLKLKNWKTCGKFTQ